MIFEFIITALVIELTPGPNMMWIALLSISRGFKVALISIIGIAFGLSVAGVAAAFGVSALISNTPILFQALRWLGTIYLLYLAWDSFRISKIVHKDNFDKSLMRYFFQGLIVNVLNPKAYLVYAAVLPQFINLDQPKMAQLITLSAIYVLIATLIHLAIARLAGNFTKLVAEPKWARLLGRIFASLLIIVAIWFFYSTKMK